LRIITMFSVCGAAFWLLPVHDALEIVMKTQSLNPPITLGEEEQRCLTILAMAGTGHSANAADDLLYEMERARVMPDADVPPSIIRMGSRVKYRTNAGDERRVRLVYPEQADALRGEISVLTPEGIALVGLSEGQSIAWLLPDGGNDGLRVLDVYPPDTME
jgi:regulator of nucleoside diphosphate kinase